MRLILAAVAVLAIGTSAQAQNARKTAEGLGAVFAAEQECGLTYDRGAITAFIRQQVPADDMEFPGWLTYFAGVAATQLEQMGASAKVAYCAQIEQIAETYGFLAAVPGDVDLTVARASEPKPQEPPAAPELPEDKLGAAKGTAAMLVAERHCDGIALDHAKLDRMIAIETAINAGFEQCARESCHSEAETELLAMSPARRDAHCTYWRQTISRIGLAR